MLEQSDHNDEVANRIAVGSQRRPTAAATTCASLPNSVGVGLKPEHYETILAERPDVGWFEVHPENYMGLGGPPHQYLSAIRKNYPLSLHGVGLSIGSAGRLDRAHLARLRTLAARYEPESFSEHLAWSSHDEGFFNDLLPLPYTVETLRVVCDHIDETQEAVGRRMLLENPATYVVFKQSTFDEIDFLGEIARRTGCGLLLDVNNVHVSCVNHGHDATAYLARFPVDLVGEIHLAGHVVEHLEDGGRLLIDSHDRRVIAEVWTHYAAVIARAGPIATLIEWDSEIPDCPILHEEAKIAERILDLSRRGNSRQEPAKVKTVV